MEEVLKRFKEVEIEKPVDVIIRQIKDLLSTGQLKPGDRLPPERKLSEKFGVGRTHVRDAIRKLEFYGILKTRPQSGTFVAGIGITALESLISDVLKMDSSSFLSLVETRELLEMSTIAFACQRRTEEDLLQLEVSLNNYLEKANQNISAVEEDLMFHLTIAECSKNKVLKSLLLIIIPDIISNYSIFKVCDTITQKALGEHKLMFDFIKEGKCEAASNIMKEHLTGVMDFAKSLNQPVKLVERF
jgi:GntR family transcriptional regulator, transcriptional repressor for pyruvate dehydrogenase complex